MPGYIHLRLLNAQDEYISANLVGAIIESDARYYRRRAMAAQAEWFDHPDLEHQREYAFLLERWAKATDNRRALAHARSLLTD
jgi:hypothetical protein